MTEESRHWTIGQEIWILLFQHMLLEHYYILLRAWALSLNSGSIPALLGNNYDLQAVGLF